MTCNCSPICPVKIQLGKIKGTTLICTFDCNFGLKLGTRNSCKVVHLWTYSFLTEVLSNAYYKECAILNPKPEQVITKRWKRMVRKAYSLIPTKKEYDLLHPEYNQPSSHPSTWTGPKILISCPVKVQIHTNPDGSKVEIRNLDIGEYSFWDEFTQDWIKADKKKRREDQKKIAIPQLS